MTSDVGTVTLDPSQSMLDPGTLRSSVESLTPGVGSVKSWQVTAASAGGSLTLTVVVTGDKGAATLIADGQGKVLQHSGG